ncbi:MAG: adenylate/guanylate cyclase domain-containing protein [Phycisphaerales bacterium]
MLDPIGNPQHEIRAGTSLRVLLCTDIVGSTAKVTRLTEPVYLPQLKRHNEIIEASISAEPSARILKIVGDAYFIFFTSSAEAVRSALRIQFSITREQWKLEPLQVRMLVYSSEFVIYDSSNGRFDIAGDAINMASRLQELVIPNQILLNRAAFDAARAQLGSDFTDRNEGTDRSPQHEVKWLNHGAFKFKGDIDPRTGEQCSREVCEVGLAGIAPLKPPVNVQSSNKSRAILTDVEPSTLTSSSSSVPREPVGFPNSQPLLAWSWRLGKAVVMGVSVIVLLAYAAIQINRSLSQFNDREIEATVIIDSSYTKIKTGLEDIVDLKISNRRLKPITSMIVHVRVPMELAPSGKEEVQEIRIQDLEREHFQTHSFRVLPRKAGRFWVEAYDPSLVDVFPIDRHEIIVPNS